MAQQATDCIIRPSDLTRTDCDIYLLHLEILDRGACAMDPAKGFGASFRKTGAPPALDWAIDYSRCIFGNDRAIIEQAHVREIDGRRNRQAAWILTRFYRRLHKRGVYDQGLRYLRSMGG